MKTYFPFHKYVKFKCYLWFQLLVSGSRTWKYYLRNVVYRKKKFQRMGTGYSYAMNEQICYNEFLFNVSISKSFGKFYMLKKDLYILVWFDFCFTALRHILGHVGRGQLT